MLIALCSEAFALNRIFDRVDPFLKDDLLRGMFELLAGKPAPMRHRPVAASAVNPAVPQQKGEQLLALPTKIVSRGLAGADKIAHGLVRRIGRPHARQFAGPMKPRQRDRIPPVRLDPTVSESEPERQPCIRGRALGFGDKAHIPLVRLQSRHAAGRIGPPIS